MKVWFFTSVFFLLFAEVVIQPADAETAAPPPVLETMKGELDRSMSKLQLAGEQKPYFISYMLIDRAAFSTQAMLGALTGCQSDRNRFANVVVRVGSHKLDNVPAPEDMFNSDDATREFNEEYDRVPVPLTDDPTTLRRSLWLLTDMRYKRALRQLAEKEGKRMGEVDEERPLDFSYEKPETLVAGRSGTDGSPASFSIDTNAWKSRVKDYSAAFIKYPEILESSVSFSVQSKNDYFVSSEGSKLMQGKVYWWLRAGASAKAADGMWVRSYRHFFGWSESDLPAADVVERELDALCREVLALKKAPVMEAYTGPAIITNEAAGVFIHEAIGHRLESHRQGSKEYGETFKDKIGKKILPEFVSIFDDPTLTTYRGMPLDGYYRFDEEGVLARRVDAVRNGVLETFLSWRKPITGLDKSNGHGRAQMQGVGYGDMPVARQANLILETSRSLPFASLKKMLLDECHKKNKPYGLIFGRCEGGVTGTDRGIMEAFQSMPLVVYRVDARTGTEELVRGVKYGSTPLVVLDKIEAAGDDPAAFNGFCGAESGSVPAALVAPSLLLSELEIAKIATGKTKPPILTPPF